MKKYFKKLDKKFEIDASIREMVEFKQLNLVDETAFPSSEFKPWSIDVIFCRNVFIYFPTEQIQNVTCRFKRCLTEGGWLITSPVEVSNEGLKSLRYEWHPGVGVLRKDSSIASEKLQNTTCSHQKTSTENISNTSQIKNTVLAYQHSSKSTNFTPASEIDLLLEKATIAFENGQYCVASGHIKSILKQRKNHMDASILQARIFANLGDHNGALIVLKNLLKRHTENAYIYYLLANTYAEMEQKNMAEQSARQALYLDPDMISAQFLMGNIMQAQGNSRASKKHYKNLMQLLSRYEKDELLPELDGMTTGALYEIVNCLL